MTSFEHKQKPRTEVKGPCRNKRLTRIQISEKCIATDYSP